MNSVILLLFLVFVLDKIQTGTSKPKQGPFVSKPFRIEKCLKPTRPYAKNPSVLMEVELYNTTDKACIRGNVTIVTDEPRTVSVKARYYRYEGGERKIIQMLNGGDCRGMIVSTTMLALGIRYDSKKCSAPVGTYHFANMEPNRLEHMWSANREYGHFLWITEMMSKSSTLICYEYESIVSPLKTKNTKRGN